MFILQTTHLGIDHDLERKIFMTAEPKFDLKINDKLEGMLVIVCPQCKKKTEKKFQELNAGKKVSCSCGFAFTFANNTLLGIQRSLNDLKRSLNSFGK